MHAKHVLISIRVAAKRNNTFATLATKNNTTNSAGSSDSREATSKNGEVASISHVEYLLVRRIEAGKESIRTSQQAGRT
jgi:hypothetical protein